MLCCELVICPIGIGLFGLLGRRGTREVLALGLERLQLNAAGNFSL